MAESQKLGIDDGGHNRDAKSMTAARAWAHGYVYADRVPFARFQRLAAEL